MPLPLAPIFVAGATAAIGWFFQENSARNARRRQHADAELIRERQLREAEINQAQEICEEISNAMDLLYYYLSHSAMPVAVRRATKTEREPDDAKSWDGYENAELAWMTHKTRFTAQARRYFGEQNHKRLTDIQDAFQKAGSLVDATYYDRKHSVVKNGKEQSGKYYGIVKPLENDLRELTEQMIRAIQDQNVGRLRSK